MLLIAGLREFDMIAVKHWLNAIRFRSECNIESSISFEAPSRWILICYIIQIYLHSPREWICQRFDVQERMSYGSFQSILSSCFVYKSPNIKIHIIKFFFFCISFISWCVQRFVVLWKLTDTCSADCNAQFQKYLTRWAYIFSNSFSTLKNSWSYTFFSVESD